MSAASVALSSVPVSELTSFWGLPSLRYARQDLLDWPAAGIPFQTAAEHDRHSTVQGVLGQRSCRIAAADPPGRTRRAFAEWLVSLIRLAVTITYVFGRWRLVQT